MMELVPRKDRLMEKLPKTEKPLKNLMVKLLKASLAKNLMAHLMVPAVDLAVAE